MSKLKLGTIPDDKPVKLTIELPAAIHRDLIAYGNALGRETDQGVVEPAKLIGPMLARFMATDRGFAKLRRTSRSRKQRTLGNPDQNRRRERASSRMKATNRPTAGSSASGHQTSSTRTQAFSSRMGR